MFSKPALRPDFFKNFPILSKDEEAKTRGVNENERMLYGLSQTAGWNLLKKDIDQLLIEMDQLNESAIANGVSYEELGRNTLVINLAKGVIRRILNKVEDAKEACEREQPTGGNPG